MNKTLKMLGLLGLYGMMVLAVPGEAKAAEAEVETTTSLYAKIDASTVTVRDAANTRGQVVTQVASGDTFEVLGSGSNGWIRIETGRGMGYIPESRATVFEKTTEKVDENVALRKSVVNYALQFVGNRYVYGGTDPNRGVDCSGFTRYVLMHSAGVNLEHSSGAQSRVGRTITMAQAKPGDLIFYGGSGYINHVALYMGNGQVVHASSARTGIKISDATYRTPVKVVSVLN